MLHTYLERLISLLILLYSLDSQACFTYGTVGVKWLVSEAALWPLVAQMTPLATLALFGCSLDVSGTGMLLAKERVGVVVGNMSAVFAAVLVFTQIAKNMVRTGG